MAWSILVASGLFESVWATALGDLAGSDACFPR